MELCVCLFDDGEPSEHDFVLVGGPLDTDNAAILFAALGHAAASWARLEKHIDILLIQINKSAHSSEVLNLYDPNHPRPFSDKLKLLKRYFNRHPALAPYKKVVGHLASRLKATSLERNEHLHAALESYDANKKIGTFKSIEFLGNDNYRITKTEQPLEQIFDLIRRINNLNRDLGKVSERLFTTDALARLGKP